MAQNSLYGSRFYLTARAGEQLPRSEKQNDATYDTKSTIGEYVSTVAQDTIASKNENEAITYNAIADFSLNKSFSLNNFNAYMRKIQQIQNVA